MANKLCCCGVCSICSPVPAQMILTMPLLQDWYDYEDSLDPGNAAANMDANQPTYRCWELWANGGCANCDTMSGSEQTLRQYPIYSSSNCDGTTPICEPDIGAGCVNQGIADCVWQKLIPVCTITDDFWGQDIVSINCCANTWDAFGDVSPFTFGNPWTGGVPCMGYETGDDCPPFDFDTSTFLRTCDCGTCGQDGQTMCPSGCCYMVWGVEVQVSGPSGGFYAVSANVAQWWKYGTISSNGCEVMSGVKLIAEEDWNCLATEVEFTLDDIAINSCGFTTGVPMCRFNLDGLIGTDVVFKVRKSA